jgi:D-beta-D-heptose 7-phosphate kinase/D-beta-D-heptose 1-phosphate adenosyltransferase
MLASFSQAKVACVGDLMLDCYVYGNVDRISPEAPVPVLHIKSAFSVVGGAGNVVRNLSSLGVYVDCFGIVGSDAAGAQVEMDLRTLPTVTTYLRTEGKTSQKTRYVSQGHQLLRVDDETISAPSRFIQEGLCHDIIQKLTQSQVLILSDYGKGLLTADLCQEVISEARKNSIQVVVDPKGMDYSKYRGATVITPNLKELSLVYGSSLATTDDIVRAARSLLTHLDVKAILVTRGAEGMSLVTQSTDPLHIPTQAQDIFDVSGAGDTVVATLAVALACGMTLEDAAFLSNVAAGIVVGKAGTATVTLEEITSAQASQQSRNKILSLEMLKQQVQTWHHQGLTVGFTNGCFDLLHLGHLHLLEDSKRQCDRLIVAINSDESIKRLKGEERPLQSQLVRSSVLAALESVDAVIIFEEDTPLRLIEEIIPDVLIKGADYTIDQVVGANVVLKEGGKVHLVDLKKGYSTTQTVQKIKAHR